MVRYSTKSFKIVRTHTLALLFLYMWIPSDDAKGILRRKTNLKWKSLHFLRKLLFFLKIVKNSKYL